MAENLTSSVNESNLRSFQGVMSEILRFHDIHFETCSPARVTKVIHEKNEVEVELLNKKPFSSTEGTVFKDTKPFTVPVYRQSGSSFIISIPVKEGDTGWVLACSRDSSNAIEKNSGVKTDDNEGPQPINTFGLHKYEFGFFIPAHWGAIPSLDDNFGDDLIVGKVDEEGKTASYVGIKDNGDVEIHQDDGNIFVNGTKMKYLYESAEDSNVKFTEKGNTLIVGAYYL